MQSHEFREQARSLNQPGCGYFFRSVNVILLSDSSTQTGCNGTIGNMGLTFIASCCNHGCTPGLNMSEKLFSQARLANTSFPFKDHHMTITANSLVCIN